MSDGFYAHTKDGADESDWQRLEDHLRGVAERSREFAVPFGAGDWGGLAGLWHDLGKYSEAFQLYLRTASSPDAHQSDRKTKTDHSTAGGQHAVEKDRLLGHLLAYAITGHHSGLLDGTSDGSCLEYRLGKAIETLAAEANSGSASRVGAGIPALVLRALSSSPRDSFALAFFVRMLFSCLVDADYLDTEHFMDPARAASRPSWPRDSLALMEAALDAHVAAFGPPQTNVNTQRDLVRRACLSAATRSPGLFSLTVPTGGGKTLASLAFALRHARLHGLRRVVYVIPFTSIIEQNAGVFREALRSVAQSVGADPVVEHHSNIDVGAETTSSRLATENWDAPVIVTTSVQFYESLFANRTSRCRKLHNLAQSVIILDEAQTLPVDFLEPCLASLRELTSNYGATVVLCTATQPAVRRSERFPIGLDLDLGNEIIPDPVQLFESLKRVKVDNLGEVDDATLVERLLREDQVLCIVNTRNHARKLFEQLGDADVHYHLSALMCPEHRSQVLKTIHGHLNSGHPCRVVSTQLIEAGVDIDFPCVYRSLAGLDSIAQAAGRCNRSGLQAEGRTFIFRSEHQGAERYFADTTNAASQVLVSVDDPLSLEANERYFRLYYGDQSDRWDSKSILKAYHVVNNRALPFDFRFETVARDFRLIESIGKPVIIPWDDQGQDLCTKLRRFADAPDRDLLRQLQRYTVQVPAYVWDRYIGSVIELVGDRFPVLVSIESNYSDRLGLELDGDSGTLLCV
jgi:CRISPR-associated endonuclease/helicase Cas3